MLSGDMEGYAPLIWRATLCRGRASSANGRDRRASFQ